MTLGLCRILFYCDGYNHVAGRTGRTLLPDFLAFSVSPEANEHPCERIARKKPGASMVALIALGAALDGGVGRGEATISEALLGVGTDGSGVEFTGCISITVEAARFA